MSAGNYAIACARFRDSDRLDPAVGTRFNLADCEERRGRIATAWSLFRGVVAELGADDDRKPIAEQRAKSLEPRLPYVTLRRVTDTPSGARVRVDGTELGEGSFDVALPMDPGAHELVLVTETRQERRPFTLAEGQQSDVPIRFSPAEPAPNAPPDGSSQRTWGYVVGGVGVAGVLTGIVAGVVTLGKKSTADDHCSDARQVCDETGRDANRSGKTFGVVSGVGLGVGVVGLAAGAYLLLTAPAEPARAAARYSPAPGGVRVSPEINVGSRTGFVGLRGSF